MAASGDSRAAAFGPAGRAELEEVLDAELVKDATTVGSASRARPRSRHRNWVAERNLFALGERLAAWAATPATRRQYAPIYAAFAAWLSGSWAGRRGSSTPTRRLGPAP